jgi:uncharacterized protein
MSVQSILQWFLPKEDHFYTYLERQAQITHQAAQTLGMFRAGTAANEIRSSVERLEVQGDQTVRDMLASLARTFVTPIDREDLQRVSKKLDDILDLLDLAARACVLYGVEKPTRPMLVLIEKLEAATEAISQAMPLLRQHRYQALIKASQQVQDIEKDADTVFRDALSALFHDPAVDAKTILREKEVLEDLEKALNRCEQVAETLTNVAVKHG